MEIRYCYIFEQYIRQSLETNDLKITDSITMTFFKKILPHNGYIGIIISCRIINNIMEWKKINNRIIYPHCCFDPLLIITSDITFHSSLISKIFATITGYLFYVRLYCTQQLIRDLVRDIRQYYSKKDFVLKLILSWCWRFV